MIRTCQSNKLICKQLVVTFIVQPLFLSEPKLSIVYFCQNPRAIKIAWINLYLNALDDNGLPVYDREGKTLLDRVEFHESDLLSHSIDNKIELDCIVGCIPQVRLVITVS